MSASFFNALEGSLPPFKLTTNGETSCTISACVSGLSKAPLALIGLPRRTSRKPAWRASMVRIEPAAARYALLAMAGAAIKYAPTPTFSKTCARLAKAMISVCLIPLKVGFGRGVAPALVRAACKNETWAVSSFIISVKAALLAERAGIDNVAVVAVAVGAVVGVLVLPVVAPPQAASSPRGATTAAPTTVRRRKVRRDAVLVIRLDGLMEVF